MGGIVDSVEGRTKVATWLAFKRGLCESGLASRREQERAGLFLVYPSNKKEAYRSMRRTPGGGWQLEYHLHT